MKSTKRVLAVALLLMCANSLWAVSTDFFTCDHYSYFAKTGEQVQYAFSIENNTQQAQTYHLSIDKPRELCCAYTLSDTLVVVQPNESYQGQLSVYISDRLAIGGLEHSTLIITSEDQGVSRHQFTSVSEKNHPYLLVTDDLLAEAKEKAATVAWANKSLESLVKIADDFKVPALKVFQSGRLNRTWPALKYKSNTTEQLFYVALAWRLTGNEMYLDKVLSLVRDVCNPEKGYMTTGHATTGVQVHEGYFFSFLAATCDLLYNEDVLTEADKENIETSMRYYLHLAEEDMCSLGIMNHQASANVGAVLVSLFLQDMTALKHFVESDGGLIDQISKGTMGDGWWFEGTPGYCNLVVQRFTYAAVAFDNYGLNLFDQRFPTKYKSKDFDNVKEDIAGMKFDIWGPPGRSTRGLEEMYLAYVPMMDEKGILVANNDGKATPPAPFYEIAYRYFRQDNVAWLINNSPRDTWEALVYGVVDVPKVADPRQASATQANIGLTALRSDIKGKRPDEQIQAYLKYGTHGGWHGQFDRTGMIALDRYGHKYFGTEMCWFGYGDAGYKECVQTSATHNMVIADEMQQEAVPSTESLFYAGELMQVSLTETNARWRKIPTFNIEKNPAWDDYPYSADTVLQQRLAIVTDDYLVLADFLTSSAVHDFDWLIHPVGLKSTEGMKKSGQVMAQLSTEKTSPYKFFKQAQWFKMREGSKVHFAEGEMKLDVHTLYPRKTNVFTASYPTGGKYKEGDFRNNPDRSTYGIRSRGKEVAFLNVIEPYKGESAIVSIESNTPRRLTVTLADGRVQVIVIDRSADSKVVNVKITESVNGDLVREESTLD